MNKHDIELPPLVGTLAALPDRHREVIEAYGQACARAAVEQAEAYADARVQALQEALGLALEYWAERQQRYKNRHPVWVQKARAALKMEQ